MGFSAPSSLEKLPCYGVILTGRSQTESSDGNIMLLNPVTVAAEIPDDMFPLRLSPILLLGRCIPEHHRFVIRYCTHKPLVQRLATHLIQSPWYYRRRRNSTQPWPRSQMMTAHSLKPGTSFPFSPCRKKTSESTSQLCLHLIVHCHTLRPSQMQIVLSLSAHAVVSPSGQTAIHVTDFLCPSPAREIDLEG